jgi:argininosuccinate lyase
MTDKPWGGRFTVPTDEFVEAFTASIDIDQRMYAEDIAGSRAHARMLAGQNILTGAELAVILQGLNDIETEIEAGEFAFLTELEDIHMNVEKRLIDRIGEAGRKLHTARSRNDQVATDLRLYLRRRCHDLLASLRGLQQALVDAAEVNADAIMPGFTHLQVAQPVTLGHHLLAYVEMLERDAGRFRDACARLNQCPLGAAALAGTTFAIDRHMTAEELGFDSPCANSLDAVSDRDFVLELLAAASISAVHLSRLAEELIIWGAPQFGFVELSDAYCTGSSIMPQKKNPDVPELVRGKSGRIFGHLMAMLATVKGLPLAYNKDLQEDKLPVFDGLDQLQDCLIAFTGMIPGMQVNRGAMLIAAASGFSTATDLADLLVRAGVSFRAAHEIVGRAVAYCIEQSKQLEQLDAGECGRLDERLTADMVAKLSLQASVAARDHWGGTAPAQVTAQCQLWRERWSS